MATCATCNKTIVFGGVRDNGYRFCSKSCHRGGQLLIAAQEIPADVVKELAREVHSSACPVCGKRRGPVDVHTAHRVWSFIVWSSWVSRPRVSCRSCGLKFQFTATLSSLLFGWWGIPWGLIMTPVQVSKNFYGMARPHESTSPSKRLEEVVRFQLAAREKEQPIADTGQPRHL